VVIILDILQRAGAMAVVVVAFVETIRDYCFGIL
jgi:hypothetical protein